MTIDGGLDDWASEGLDVARRIILDAVPDAGEPISAWDEDVIHGSGSGALGSIVVRVAGRSPRWSAIVKLVRRTPFGPAHRDSWTREVAVARSAWLADRLPRGMELPTCLGATTSPGCAVLVMEEIRLGEPGFLVPGSARITSSLLGRLAAVPVGPDIPEWASRDFLRLEAEATVDLAPSAISDPPSSLVAVHEAWAGRFARVCEAAGDLVAALDRLPATFQHLDASSRNIAVVDGLRVVIDWALAGMAPIGVDAAAFLGISAMHADVAPGEMAMVHDAVIDGYLDGVRAVRGDVAESDVRWAISAALSLRFARFLTQVHEVMHHSPDLPAAIAGRPIDTVLDAWRVLAETLVPHADRALARAR